MQFSECDCGICFNSIDPVENPRGVINSCQHIFCGFCIEEWGKQTNTCPLCKRRFTRIHIRDHETDTVREIKVRKRDYRGHEAESSDEEEDEWEAAGEALLGREPAADRGLRCAVCNLATQVADMLLCETRTCSATVHPECRRDGKGPDDLWRCDACCAARGGTPTGAAELEPEPLPARVMPTPPETTRSSPSPANPANLADDSAAWLGGGVVLVEPAAPPRWSPVDGASLIATQQSKGLAELARRKAARNSRAELTAKRPPPTPLIQPPARSQPPATVGPATATPTLPSLITVRRDAFEAKFAQLKECVDRRHDTLLRYGVVRQHGPDAARSMKDAAAAREDDMAAARAEAQAYGDRYVERVVAERKALEDRHAARKAIEEAAALRKLQALIASKHQAWAASRPQVTVAPPAALPSSSAGATPPLLVPVVKKRPPAPSLPAAALPARVIKKEPK